jgi:hypothetical protein
MERHCSHHFDPAIFERRILFAENRSAKLLYRKPVQSAHRCKRVLDNAGDDLSSHLAQIPAPKRFFLKRKLQQTASPNNLPLALS